MPIYEYECNHCQDHFSELRSSSEMDDPIACPQCGTSEARRLLSGFAVGGKSKETMMMPCGAPNAAGCGGHCAAMQHSH
ncbi:MAG: zinc ribbon domain-containing protein [SAR324 cluster bacterium]|nr:zinc ribbon domain-containing protein [SAR324 cluster bacterium]